MTVIKSELILLYMRPVLLLSRSYIYLHWISSAILPPISQIQQILLQFSLKLLQNIFLISTSPGNQLVFILFHFIFLYLNLFHNYLKF